MAYPFPLLNYVLCSLYCKEQNNPQFVTQSHLRHNAFKCTSCWTRSPRFWVKYVHLCSHRRRPNFPAICSALVPKGESGGTHVFLHFSTSVYKMSHISPLHVGQAHEFISSSVSLAGKFYFFTETGKHRTPEFWISFWLNFGQSYPLEHPFPPKNRSLSWVWRQEHLGARCGSTQVLGGWGRKIAMCFRPAWAVCWMRGQPGLHNTTLS